LTEALDMDRLTGFQQTSLVILRTLIGWHFFYEGYYKLMLPGWTRAGRPMAAWSASGYLNAATGPLAGLFHGMAHAANVGHTIDIAVPIGLTLVGLSLMLGLFTRAGCIGALVFLTLFYISAPPLAGLPQPQTEGAYLIVNKNLIELAAVLTLLAFRTEYLAGLDRVFAFRRARSITARSAAA
jgi:thiosulfate dehydrogenase (quinone) large subunit